MGTLSKLGRSKSEGSRPLVRRGCYGVSPYLGSWVVISRVIGKITIVITYVRGLITPLITTHEPNNIRI